MKVEMALNLKKNTLLVGFDPVILTELRSRFNVRFVISDDTNSDMAWFSLHNLTIPVRPAKLTHEMIECLNVILKHYRQFADINSRRYHYITENDSEVYNRFVLTFSILYKVLFDNKIELILFSNLPHEGFDFILYQIAKFLNISTIMCYQSLIPNRFWITSCLSDFGKFDNCPKLFDKISSNYTLPTTWFYMQGSNNDASYSFKQMFFEISRRFYRLPAALIRFYYARQYRLNVRKMTQNIDPDARYIYFPLHLQPELTTSSIGGVYSDQLLAIEALSAWLPSGYYIYLKENPKQTEKQRGSFFYKRLEALNNVVLLDRNHSSVQLIKNSIGVATITGTAGWEALFYNKPVLIFGHAWYREFDGVLEFDLSLNFDNFRNIPRLDNSALVDRLDETLTRAGKGVVDPAYSGLVEGYDDQRNAREVAASLYLYANS